MTIAALIDKRDTLEIVRDAVAYLLVTGLANQRALATVAGKDPAPWALRVFSDRSRPWPQFLEHPEQLAGQPVVNILIESTEVQPSASGVVQSQARLCVFHLDCYGYGLSQADGSGGHVAGDRVAALEGQRAARIVRNLLMAAANVSLGLQGLVWRRMVRSIEAFDPALQSTRAGQNVLGARVTLEALIGEQSPQVEPVGIEAIGVTILDETGEVTLAAADWPVTPYSPPAAAPYADPPVTALAVDTLIDAPDMFEIVRAQVASILAIEAANQQLLAVAAGRDTEPWALRVFEERSDPWASFLDSPASPVPIVNVQWGSSAVQPSASGVVHSQVYVGRYTVDVYASGQSAPSGAGHVSGDELAARRAQRAARLVRNILMAAEHVTLGLAPRVGQRMIVSTTAYRSEPGPLQNVAVVRLDLDVRFSELAPQVAPVVVSGVGLDILRAETGELYAAGHWTRGAVGSFPVTLVGPGQ